MTCGDLVELMGIEPTTPCLQSAGELVGGVRQRPLSRAYARRRSGSFACACTSWLPDWLPVHLVPVRR